ncbi:1-acyl-sn-glycerol-3-phosphate acyltransferase [Myxococcota bacterium]|nr:1-acyl-sn-glycerol-3-phosphate acyltransferase [Myxococcota bacterium]
MKPGWRQLLDHWFDQSDRLSVLLDPIVWPRLQIAEADRERLLQVPGVPVYVFRAASELDYLLLTVLLRHLDLLVPQVHHPSFLLVASTSSWMDKLLGSVLPSPGGGVQHTVSRILDRSPAYVALFGHNPTSETADPLALPLFEHLVSELRQSPDAPPLVAVPVTIIWNKKGVRKEENVPLLNRILGEPEVPGRLRVIASALSSFGQPTVKIGSPLDLLAFGHEHEALPVPGAAAVLLAELTDRIEHEWRVQLGPKLQPFDAIRRELARNPEVVSAYHQAIRDGLTPRQAHKEIQAALAEIPAAPSTATLAMYKSVLQVVWTRLYRGFDVDQAGFASMREAARKGSLLLLPCHRSHMDYLILSWLMERYDLPIPHIAAGKNLSFWPMGPIFRRGGAFFIRRSFKGNKLYKTILVEYLATLLRTGVNVEFFPEGTRSRTGKAVYPRTGLLAMIAELVVTRKVPAPQIVPIAIGYEKVVEEDAYLQEMEGRTKQAENLTSLVRAGAVILNRYGRVNVQVAPPFDMAEFLGEIDPASPAFKQRVDQLGLRVISDIVAASVVTSTMLTAAALLATGETVCPLREVEERFWFFRELALVCGAKCSRKLLDEQGARTAFQKSLGSLSAAATVTGNRVFVLQNHRGTLAYYRNGFSQTVIEACIVTAASHAPQLRDTPTGPWLRRCLRREFPQFSLETPPSLPEAALNRLATLTSAQASWILSLVLDLIEGQATVCTRLATLVKDKTSEKQWTGRQLTTEVRSFGKAQLRRGSLWRPESLSAQVISESVEWLADEGLLVRDETGRHWQFPTPLSDTAAALHRQARLRTQWIARIRKLALSATPAP